jgi:hypothetical protein
MRASDFSFEDKSILSASFTQDRMMESRLAKILSANDEEMIPQKFKYSKQMSRGRKLTTLKSLDSKIKKGKDTIKTTYRERNLICLTIFNDIRISRSLALKSNLTEIFEFNSIDQFQKSIH